MVRRCRDRGHVGREQGDGRGEASAQALRGSSPADNDLRNVRDGLWNEAEEIAHYDLIEAAAEALGDQETAKLARTYRSEEEKMQRSSSDRSRRW